MPPAFREIPYRALRLTLRAAGTFAATPMSDCVTSAGPDQKDPLRPAGTFARQHPAADCGRRRSRLAIS